MCAFIKIYEREDCRNYYVELDHVSAINTSHMSFKLDGEWLCADIKSFKRLCDALGVDFDYE